VDTPGLIEEIPLKKPRYAGIFSGQITGASGTIDLEMENQTSGIVSDGSCSSENILDFIADLQISGENMSGTVGPFSNDYYFFFNAIQE
jgi:hypothetical protein